MEGGGRLGGVGWVSFFGRREQGKYVLDQEDRRHDHDESLYDQEETREDESRLFVGSSLGSFLHDRPPDMDTTTGRAIMISYLACDH